MKCCDICGERTEYLAELLTSYQTTDIREVCRECEKVLNEHKSKLQTVTARILTDWLKRFIAERRAQFEVKRCPGTNPPPTYERPPPPPNPPRSTQPHIPQPAPEHRG